MVTNLAFIPLRAGSKSIRNKNIKDFNGRPLAYWTVKECVNCKLIDKVVIATDSLEIWNAINENLKSDKLHYFPRNPETATDTASTESVINNFIDQGGIDFKNLILVQATSPLLKSKDIERGIELVTSKSFDSALSVVREKRFIWQFTDGVYEPVNYSLENRPRRQDFDGFLVENGALYITSKNDFLINQVRLNGKVGVIEMASESYFEIDEPSDWEIVQALHKKSMLKDYKSKIKKIKLIAFDVDGVLTDSGMYYSNAGDELKKFNTRDGKAVELLKQYGYQIAIITSESTKIVANRAKKLHIEHVVLGAQNKLEELKKLTHQLGVNLDEVAFIGDDINDHEVLKSVGFSICPKDAIDCNLKVVDYVSSKNGGDGVIRDISELFLIN